jgi:ribonuclease P protein component
MSAAQPAGVTTAPPPARPTLTSAQRLVRSADFRQIFDHGKSGPGRFLVVWVRAAPEASLRVGVVASRRNFRRAVWRNRAKRLLREAFRLNRHKLRGDVDVVLVARQAIRGVKRQDVEKDLLYVARKMGLLAAQKP